MGTYFLNIVVCLCFCLFERGLVFAQNSQEYDALVEWRQEKKKRLNHTHLIHTHEIQFTPVFFPRTKKSEKRRRQSVLMKVMLPKHTCTVSLKVEIEKNSKRNRKRKRSGFYHCTSHTGTGEKKKQEKWALLSFYLFCTFAQIRLHRCSLINETAVKSKTPYVFCSFLLYTARSNKLFFLFFWVLPPFRGKKQEKRKWLLECFFFLPENKYANRQTNMNINNHISEVPGHICTSTRKKLRETRWQG